MEDREDRRPNHVQGTDACDILVMLTQKCREARRGVSNRKVWKCKGRWSDPLHLDVVHRIKSHLLQKKWEHKSIDKGARVEHCLNPPSEGEQLRGGEE